MNFVFTLVTSLIGVAIFIGMLGALELGRWVTRRRRSLGEEGEGSETGLGALNGAVFGLLGLLIAFTFSGAAERFEGRRHLIVQEANALGTAYLRLDILLPEARAQLQEKFRRYVDSRIKTNTITTLEELAAEDARDAALQRDIWSAAVIGVREAGGSAPVVLLPALNEAIDITTTRAVAREAHPPKIIYAMLILLSLLSAVLAGMGMPLTSAKWVPRVVYAAATAATIFITIDLEYPRLGFIRIDDADHILRDVRAGLK